MNDTLLDTYRLSAFFAANPTATVKDAEKLDLDKTSGLQFYWNCVHLRDPKGEHPYIALKSVLPDKDYDTLRTRYTAEQQAAIIEGFQSGETVHQVARRLSFLPQPVTFFSIVYRMAFPTNVPAAKDKWVPYSRRQFESMAEQLRSLYKEGKKRPDDMQPELGLAIFEMFSITSVELRVVDEDEYEAELENILSQIREEKGTSPPRTPPQPEPLSDNLREILLRLDRIEQALSPTTPELPSVEAKFALDVAIPHHIDRWLSKEALALFCKLVRGGYHHNRDEDSALLELEEFGLVEIPRHSGRDVMSGVTLLIDRLKVTDKGWSLHRLIRDICEQTVYCCLTDLGSFMGFNLAVKENDENDP
jgi:hypothetical protein